jgi:hypothetical protein
MEKMTAAEFEASDLILRKFSEFSPKVDYIEDEETGIPRVVLTWEDNELVEFSAKEAQKLTMAQQMKLEESREKKGRFQGWAAKPEQSVTVLNFRRYGWAAADGYNAKYGYNGPTWPNGDDGGFTANSVREVIRETLALMLSQLVHTWGVPDSLVYHHEVKALFTRLADEACENPTARQQANRAIRSRNGLLGMGTVQIRVLKPDPGAREHYQGLIDKVEALLEKGKNCTDVVDDDGFLRPMGSLRAEKQTLIDLMKEEGVEGVVVKGEAS